MLAKQHVLYKGINFSLLSEIYDQLYYLKIEFPEKNIEIKCNSELKNISEKENKFTLAFYHTEMEQHFPHETEALILATGYQYVIPTFLQAVKELIRFDEDGLYDVNENYSIDNNTLFVQNAELHTHGFNAPDLGSLPQCDYSKCDPWKRVFFH